MTDVVLGFTVRPKHFYRKALEQAGAGMNLNVIFKDVSQEDKVRWEKLDALVLPGGPDIDPCYYMNHVDPDLREHTKKHKRLAQESKESKKRDAFEHALLMELFHNRGLRNFPVLGICRGMQMLAVSQGVPLYLDLKLETGMIFSKLEYIGVNVVEGSKMHRVTDATTFKALKYQHQAIRLPYFLSHKERWPDLRVTAYSHDHRMAEAIEFTDRPVMGVQFHPELSLEPAPKKVFNWLLEEAAIRAETRRMIFGEEHRF